MKTLYISDLDGTLLSSNGRPSKQTIETINSLTEQGVYFTVATARSINSAKNAIKDLKLSVPAVMMNGVFLTDTATKTHENIFFLEWDKAKQVIDIMNEGGRPPMVYTCDDDISASYTKIKHEYERNFIEERKKHYKKFQKVTEHSCVENLVYINGIDTKEIIEAIVEKLKKVDGIKFSWYLDTYSDGLYFLEVYSEKAGKWNSILKLKQMYGFDKIVAFGDNGNDVEMLKNSDWGLAVGNAQEIALNACDEVIESNDSDGVARYIAKTHKK